MKTRYVIAVGTVLLAMVGVTIAQQKTYPNPTPAVTTALPQPGVSSAPLLPAPTQSVPRLGEFRAISPAAANPEELTIDQLIEAVGGFREQKAELEKKEKAYLKVLHRKAEKQKERIDGLGGDITNVPPPIPGPVAPTHVY